MDQVRTYHAYSMAEALAAVKRDLGANAVILNTRSFQRGGILGLGRKTVFELTAMRSVDAAAQQKRDAVQRKQRLAKRYAAAQATGGQVEPKPQTPSMSDQARTKQLAQQILAEHEEQAAAKAAIARAATTTHEDDEEPILPPQPADQTTEDAQRFVLAPPADTTQQMHAELSDIRDMVGRVLDRQALSVAPRQPDLPGELFEMYLKLISQDISESLADRIVQQVRSTLDDDQMTSQAAVREAVLTELSTHIPCAPVRDARSFDGRPLTIALVGPTGVGKTTTVAKLAASFKLRQGLKVGLVTADTYRIAAVEQLRTYANIIDLPLEVALTPEAMQQAVEKLSDCHVILIDTAGRGQNDTQRLDELRAFIDAANPHEVHLVLAGTAGEKVLMHEAEAFSAVGVDKVVLTKLDEAVSFGMLINVVNRIGKQLSFFTTGQEVPNDIEMGRAQRLASLILGDPLEPNATTSPSGAGDSV